MMTIRISRSTRSLLFGLCLSALAPVVTATPRASSGPIPSVSPPASPTTTSVSKQQAVAHFVRLLAAIHTFTAHFVQIVHDPALTTVRRRQGRVWIARPGRFAWVYSAPSPEEIVADGHHVWIYEEELQQVTVRPERSALGHRPDLLLAGANDVERLYYVAYAGTEGGLSWYVLTPRTTSPFVRITLGLRGNIPVAMRLRDRLGERTDLRFYHVVINRYLSPRRFQFHTPPGTAVLEQR